MWNADGVPAQKGAVRTENVTKSVSVLRLLGGALRISGPAAMSILVMALAYAPPLRAQTIEVSPFYGYLFGNDLFEAFVGRTDVDGAPSLGVVVDVPLYSGFQVEGLFSHQGADVLVPLLGPLGRPLLARVNVDHFQAGGLQEYGGRRARPFVTGTLGLTHFNIEGDHEIRFTLGAGGGVKLFPLERFGVRLDGRVLTTFIDAGATTLACGRGTCLAALHVNMAWQAAFTAAVIVRLP